MPVAPRPARFRARSSGAYLLLVASSCFLGCAAQPKPVQSPAPPPSAAASVEAPVPEPAEPEAPPPPVDSAGFADAMALLRPAHAETTVQALAAAPGAREVYAQAALAYAVSDVPGMSLLWGMTYRAMGGGGDDAKVASALAKILNERIRVNREPVSGRVDFNVRLAPGQMPTRQDADGAVHAPLAHVFEGLFGATLTGFRPPWSIEQYYDVLSSWAALVSAHGTPLDEQVPLNGWLVTLAKSGHLEAYCYRLLGPAFPAELKDYQRSHAAELKAFDAYVKAEPLAPARAPLPDVLVRLK